MPKYHEHPSRAATLRNGEVVVLPDALKEDCTVWFAIEPRDGADAEWEGLLATRLAAERVRVCAVPFFAYDVNLGDEVAVIDSEAPVATSVLRDAGNFTFRVNFEPAERVDEDAPRRQVMADLEAHECWFDVLSPTFLAISALGEKAQAVADYLVHRQAAGELTYETGRTRQLD